MIFNLPGKSEVLMYWQNATSTILKTWLEKPRLGLITDVDGTVSPIVDVPDEAQVTPRNRELLRELQPHLTLVAVVSGRSAQDLYSRVNIPELIYIGNHGFERWRDGQVELMPEVATFRPKIEMALDEIRNHLITGMIIEDKGSTVSIHYRQTEKPKQVATQCYPFIQEIATKHGLKTFQGRMVFELRPPLKTNKGTAFHSLVTEYNLDAGLYIGDDTTDVDAFMVARQLRESGVCYTLAVGVEADETPQSVRESSDLLVSGVEDVESFFAWLLREVKASSN
jgi:trehalose 6-phosphate phosphatase